VEYDLPAPYAQDWATVVAANVLLKIRQAALAAVTNALSDAELRNQVARLLRDELSAREQELYARSQCESCADDV
jgi:hypothetical protein